MIMKKYKKEGSKQIDLMKMIRKEMPRPSAPFKEKNKKRFDWRKVLNDEMEDYNDDQV